MKTLNINVNKAEVYNEVAKTSAYEAKAMLPQDADAYNRVFTTDDDRLLLERFWVEAAEVVADQVSPFISSITYQGINQGVTLDSNFSASLSMPDTYDSRLDNTINTAVYSYFVMAITAKWFAVTNKPAADPYNNMAAANLNNALRALYHRTPPIKI